jgi:hypothetical protein
MTLDAPQSDGSIQPVACQQAGIDAWNSALAALNRRTSSGNATACRSYRRRHHRPA